MTLAASMGCAVVMACGLAGGAAGQAQVEWIPLFDGKSLAGWKEAPFNGRGGLQVKDGMIRLGKGRMTGIAWAGEFPRAG